MSAAASYRIGWGMASHRARHVYPDGTVVTLCGRRGTTRPDPSRVSRGSEGAYPAKGQASCGTCRRVAVNLGDSARWTNAMIQSADVARETHNARLDYERSLNEVWEEITARLEIAISALTELGLSPEEIAEGLDESRFQAWCVLPREEPVCICPPDLLACGGFKGKCPAHGR